MTSRRKKSPNESCLPSGKNVLWRVVTPDLVDIGVRMHFLEPLVAVAYGSAHPGNRARTGPCPH